MTRAFIDFVEAHENEDTARLLLSAARYPDIDMAAAVQQIEGRRTAREKWPSLLECADFLYPPRLNREQASSEATARYKASLLTTPRIADLTGGMGVDTLAFAKVAEHVDYVERDPQLCALMEHNCKALGVSNVSVHCADSLQWLSEFSSLHAPLSTIFIDPARRAKSGRKVAAFEDCEPNILQHLDLLRASCSKLIVKASPMIDIELAERQLGNVAEVHIVAVRGECKEVLFVCGEPQGEPRIVCGPLTFTRAEEAAAVPGFADSVGRYLFEPEAALMKAGPFRLISERYALAKLAPNTHLYTSDEPFTLLPGRVFHVLKELSRKEVSTAIPDGKAHVTTRNYPVEAAALQRQLGMKEGGDLFVVATTVGRRKLLLLCEPVRDVR